MKNFLCSAALALVASSAFAADWYPLPNKVYDGQGGYSIAMTYTLDHYDDWLEVSNCPNVKIPFTNKFLLEADMPEDFDPENYSHVYIKTKSCGKKIIALSEGRMERYYISNKDNTAVATSRHNVTPAEAEAFKEQVEGLAAKS